MTHINRKSFVFNAEDSAKLENIKVELTESVGIDTDVGVIKFLMRFYLKNRDVGAIPTTQIKGKSKWPEAVIEDLRNHLTNPTEFCPVHVASAVSKCGALEYPHTCLVNGLMRFHGFGEDFKWDEYESLPQLAI